MRGLAGLQTLHLSCVALLELLGLLRMALFHLLLLGIVAITLGQLLVIFFLLFLQFLAIFVLLIDQLLLLLFVFAVEFGIAGIGRGWACDGRQVLGVRDIVVRCVFPATICGRMIRSSGFAGGFYSTFEVAWA